MENNLKQGGNEGAIDAPDPCDPLSQDEFLNHKCTWRWFMRTQKQNHPAVSFGQLFSEHESNHYESEAFNLRLSHNAKTHSSVICREQVGVKTHFTLLQYRGLRRTPSLSKWHFYILYRRRESERKRGSSNDRAKTASAVPTYIWLASPEAGSPSYGC
jgi:hypothetical protein